MFDSHAHIGIMTENAIIASSRPCEWESVMTFPHHAIGLLAPEEEYLKEFRKAVLSSETCLIGEVGLDRRNPSPYQKTFFDETLKLSVSTGKHLVIHQVGMTQLLLEMLRSFSPLPPFIVHGFTGSAETANEIRKLGGIISLSPRCERTKHFCRLLEMDFLIETDMPSGREQTQTLRMWYKKIADAKGMELSDLEETIDERRAVFTS
ncbi:MAG: TatD family hydrolase [Bullifex sp.]